MASARSSTRKTNGTETRLNGATATAVMLTPNMIKAGITSVISPPFRFGFSSHRPLSAAAFPALVPPKRHCRFCPPLHPRVGTALYTRGERYTRFGRWPETFGPLQDELVTMDSADGRAFSDPRPSEHG